MGQTGRRLLATGLAWLSLGAGLRVSLLAPEDCYTPEAEHLRSAAVASAEWIARNQDPDGRYLYLYDRARDRIADDYNDVRHAGTTMSLYQIVLAGETDYLDAADRGTEWMLERRVDTGDGLAFASAGDPKLGSAALLTVALAHRRLATDDRRFDTELRQLGAFLLGQQRTDGSMLSFWDRSTASPRPDETSLYATGEALWALALLHEAFPGEGYDDAAWATLDYISTVRDDEEDVWPAPWPDQWAAYSLQEMGPWRLEATHTDYARAIAAQFGTMVRWESQQGDGLSGLTHGPEASAAGQGTWLEGLAMLHQLSRTDTRLGDLREPMADRLVCSASRLLDKQVTGTGNPLVDGAWFTDDETRVDHQQHALSGLLFAERVVRSGGAGDR